MHPQDKHPRRQALNIHARLGSSLGYRTTKDRPTIRGQDCPLGGGQLVTLDDQVEHVAGDGGTNGPLRISRITPHIHDPDGRVFELSIEVHLLQAIVIGP